MVQVYLTRVEDLTPWKGGGFGMFSSNDDGLNRTIRFRIHEPQRSRDLGVPPELQSRVHRALVLPTEKRLKALGREIARIEAAPAGAPIVSVRIAVWRLDYDPRTLAPQLEVLRDVIIAPHDSGQGT